MPRQSIFLMLENAVLLLLSQSSLIIQSSYLTGLDSSTQTFIRDISTELDTFVTSISRYFSRSGISVTSLQSLSTAQNQLHTQGSVSDFTRSDSWAGSQKSDFINRSFPNPSPMGNLELTVYYIVEIFLKKCLKMF